MNLSFNLGHVPVLLSSNKADLESTINGMVKLALNELGFKVDVDGFPTLVTSDQFEAFDLIKETIETKLPPNTVKRRVMLSKITPTFYKALFY